MHERLVKFAVVDRDRAAPHPLALMRPLMLALLKCLHAGARDFGTSQAWILSRRGEYKGRGARNGEERCSFTPAKHARGRSIPRSSPDVLQRNPASVFRCPIECSRSDSENPHLWISKHSSPDSEICFASVFAVERMDSRLVWSFVFAVEWLARDIESALAGLAGGAAFCEAN